MTGPSQYDVVIVGAGLIGLSVARALIERRPDLRLLVVEKEEHVALHQSSHNSGVVHSGLYYKPGSLKARLSGQGRVEMYQLCAEAGIPFRKSGKLVVATKESEIQALVELERRGRANGLSDIVRLQPDGLKVHEPAVSGIEGLFVPEAGVADFPKVAGYIADRLTESGVEIRTGFEVKAVAARAGSVVVQSTESQVDAGYLVNCGGLQSDRIANASGIDPGVRIVPFRGEYYQLDERARQLVKGLIYPVPDPRFPFLGVHFTRRIDGSVEVGPNAVLALGREHYRGTSPDWGDVRETLRYPGFVKLASRHLWSGASELVHSRFKSLYARLARQLIPEVTADDFIPGGAGVRAQAVDRAGNLVDDFVIHESESMMHVLNAPSPGATASLAIGRYVAARAVPSLNARP